MALLTADTWNSRYLNNEIGWDCGEVTRPLKEYFDQLEDKAIRILVPGCGNAHEVTYLFNSGFRNVFVLDWAKEPLEKFARENPEFPQEQLINEDFFKHSGGYDMIIEQTFFCAINPSLRKDYAAQVSKLLKPNGKLVGLLFNDEFENDKPPFGGTIEEYKGYFEPYFEFKYFEECHNSIEPRNGRELFINLVKK